MKRLIFLSAAFAAALALAVPFVGGGIASSNAVTAGSDRAVMVVESSTTVTGSVAEPTPAAAAASATAPEGEQASPAASTDTQPVEQTPSAEPTAPVEPSTIEAAAAVDDSAILASWDRLALRPVASAAPASGCPGSGEVLMTGAPSTLSAQGVQGTTADDLAVFAAQFNAIRVANCLQPVTKFIYDSCMEARLFWMAESPSSNPLDAWGHMGSVRSDGVPSVGCDGNLAGGSNNTGATVATKWWDSLAHRNSLYRPGTSVSGVCIAFAMTHGGIDEPTSFVRAAARWVNC